MKAKYLWGFVAVAAVLGAGYLYQTVPDPSEIHTVKMIDNKGNDLGIIQLSETMAGVLLQVNLKGLKSNGDHAIHIHEKGDCSPADSFTNAGGHYNPTDKSHGLRHPEGHHAGDMPNLMPDLSGVIETNILNQDITLSSGANARGRSSVFDSDGSAIVIHEGPDDHKSQPSGAAGGRLACGVIQ